MTKKKTVSVPPKKSNTVKYKVVGTRASCHHGTYIPEPRCSDTIASGLPEEYDALVVIHNIVASGQWCNLKIEVEENPTPTGA